MLDGLNQIPWNRLTHAHGAADDVPDLLRRLRTASPEATDEQSPLRHLFSNIWHQGTVYEATAYAVPFLIELATHPLVPDRLGILQLLAAIAAGRSYRDVHGNLLNEPDFAERKAVEQKWVEQSRKAVASGAATFLAMTREETDIRLAAAHVLALLPEHREVLGTRLRTMVNEETGAPQRASLLLLLGVAGNRSEAALSVLIGALSGGDMMQRRAAAVAIAYLKPDPLPDLARAAILDAITADDLENSFRGLPWDVAEVMDRERLYACLNAASREEAAIAAIVAIESGNATHQTISTVLSLIFSLRPPRDKPPLTGPDLSRLQRRAVCAMASAMAIGQWKFHGLLRLWGLPETSQRLLALASDDDPSTDNLPE
jgi:hypothetical protein